MFGAVGELVGRQVTEPIAGLADEPVAQALASGGGGSGAVVYLRPLLVIGSDRTQVVIRMTCGAWHRALSSETRTAPDALDPSGVSTLDARHFRRLPLPRHRMTAQARTPGLPTSGSSSRRDSCTYSRRSTAISRALGSAGRCQCPILLLRFSSPVGHVARR